MNGTVKFFNQSKGFGFITREGQSDLFVHITGCMTGDALKEGQQVSFDEIDGKKGPCATNVEVTGDSN